MDILEGERLNEMTLQAAADLAVRLLTVERLRALFAETGLRRRDFCDFLGIGESTLSAWLQAGRIPQSAAIAYVMYSAMNTQSKKLNEMEMRPEIIEDIDGYSVIVPNKDGAGFRKIHRRGLSFSRAVVEAEIKSPRVREALSNAAQIMADRTEHEGDFFSEAAAELEEIELLLSDPEEWIRKYRMIDVP